jgi:small-conductance mechanosensitive channel
MAQATGWTPRVEFRGVIAEYYCVPRSLAQPVAPQVSFLGGMLVLGFGLLGRLISSFIFVLVKLITYNVCRRTNSVEPLPP